MFPLIPILSAGAVLVGGAFAVRSWQGQTSNQDTLVNKLLVSLPESKRLL